MPPILRYIMYFSPSTHFVRFAEAVLFRDAGMELVWLDFSLVVLIGVLFLIAALLRFRKSIAVAQS
jgi:ABC-2 type transport system permease protein